MAVAAQAEKFFVGKRGGRLSIPQEEINALLVRLAREGRKVVRLKGGHPLVFARGGEEALALAAERIPFRVLPGVTSAFGGLASAGIPATMRGINGAVILATGFAAQTDDRPDWAALARTGQPIVIYMGLTHMADTVADLLEGGLAAETPAALVENATLPKERTVVATLGTLAEAAARENIVSPALIVDRRHRLAAREAAGRRMTRPRDHHRRAALRVRKDQRHDRAAQGLKRRGMRVRGAKSGPDYIDPGFHAAATGRPGINLDSWAMPPEMIAALAAEAAADTDIVVIESAMGLFDGIPAEAGTFRRGGRHRAAFGVPVLLVLDVSGQSQTAAAVAKGFASYDPACASPASCSTGSAANGTGGWRATRSRRSGIPVVGAMMRDPTLTLPERHLGLVQAGEHEDIEAHLERLADVMERSIDIDRCWS